MILYHFTLADRTEQILEHGLLPRDDRRNIVGGEQVVWLTQQSDTCCSEAESAMFYERTGIAPTHWLLNLADIPVVRFKVRIPSHERKLARWESWSRKHPWVGMPDLDNILFKRSIKNDWIYFGRIAPSKIVEAHVESEPRGNVRYRENPRSPLSASSGSQRLSAFELYEREPFDDAFTARSGLRQ
jgi:hypothetical protein